MKHFTGTPINPGIFVKRLSVCFDGLHFRNHKGMAFDLKVSSPFTVHHNLKSFINLFPCPLPVPNLLPPQEKKKDKKKAHYDFYISVAMFCVPL